MQDAGSSRYTSPLEFSCPGPSGYRKRSASLVRGSGAKRGRCGRGVSPSPNSARSFRK